MHVGHLQSRSPPPPSSPPPFFYSFSSPPNKVTLADMCPLCMLGTCRVDFLPRYIGHFQGSNAIVAIAIITFLVDISDMSWTPLLTYTCSSKCSPAALLSWHIEDKEILESLVSLKPWLNRTAKWFEFWPQYSISKFLRKWFDQLCFLLSICLAISFFLHWGRQQKNRNKNPFWDRIFVEEEVGDFPHRPRIWSRRSAMVIF